MSPETVIFVVFGLVALVGGILLDRRARSSVDFLREGASSPIGQQQAMSFRAAVRIGFVRSQYSRCTISSERITMKVAVPGGAGEYFVERADVERAVAVRAITAGRGIRFVKGGKVHDTVTLWVAGGTEWDDRLREFGWA